MRSILQNVVIASLSFGFAIALTGSYDSCFLVNSDLDYQIHWRIDEANGYYYIGQSANVDGWLGFGLSANGFMDSSGAAPGSDIVVGYVDSGACANGCVNDYSALKHEHPILDGKQDAELLSASKSGGRLELEWRKKLNTGDPADRIFNPNVRQSFIWSANHHRIPTSATTLSPHSHIPLIRGPEINFMTKSRCSTNSSDEREMNIVLEMDVPTFDLGKFKTSMAAYMGVAEEQIEPTDYFEQLDDPCPSCLKMNLKYENYAVTTSETQYICHGFVLPNDIDRHIVAFEVIKDNTQVLHHIIVYQTDTAFATGATEYPDCSTMPQAAPVWAWAPGTFRYVLPVEAGVKVGPTGARYFVLQLHYNNPGHIAGFTDSSGIKIWLSDTLRTYDAGLMLIGPATGRILLPPRYPSWHIEGGCSAATTQAISQLPTRKITIIAETHHMHSRGRVGWTDYMRGTTLVRRYTTPSFDYNSQKFLPANHDVLPGDVIRVNCIYNTSAETANVSGCEATSCEMCLYVVMYYPMAAVSGCSDKSLELAGKNCSFPCGY